MKHEESGKDKIGSGHARAMAKLGLAELRGAFYPSSNVAQPTEYGIFGKETPGEVAQLREPGPDEEPSVLGERLKAAEIKRDIAVKGPAKENARDRQVEREDR
jgi:hypothetical protein